SFKLGKDAGKTYKKKRICTYLFIFIYVYNVCFTSGFKRGADPGMPEPTIWRYVMVPNVHTNPVQILVCVLPLASSSCE
uniref:Uncharacterized protein n=1 Tax=Ficedula albicollis TaxID=59894 RepID=A0A803W395_FICAL